MLKLSTSASPRDVTTWPARISRRRDRPNPGANIAIGVANRSALRRGDPRRHDKNPRGNDQDADCRRVPRRTGVISPPQDAAVDVLDAARDGGCDRTPARGGRRRRPCGAQLGSRAAARSPHSAHPGRSAAPGGPSRRRRRRPEAANIARDDRARGGHRLESDLAEGLRPDRWHQTHRTPEPTAHDLRMRHVRDQCHSGRKALGRVDPRCPDKHQWRRVREPLVGVKQDVDALMPSQGADKEQVSVISGRNAGRSRSMRRSTASSWMKHGMTDTGDDADRGDCVTTAAAHRDEVVHPRMQRALAAVRLSGARTSTGAVLRCSHTGCISETRPRCRRCRRRGRSGEHTGL